ncbi:hypothetical protein ACWEKT_00110 [Nocardia takedensis]
MGTGSQDPDRAAARSSETARARGGRPRDPDAVLKAGFELALAVIEAVHAAEPAR